MTIVRDILDSEKNKLCIKVYFLFNNGLLYDVIS